jgi:hypothetical protein
VAALAAESGERFDIQVLECGKELPLRASGTATRAHAYRGGFSPPADGKPEPGYRQRAFDSPAALEKGLDDDLASDLPCQKAFVGLHTLCHAYGFDLRLSNEGTVAAVEQVAVWE